MSGHSDLIAALVRAANEVERLGEHAKRRLFDRAIYTIHDMREAVGIPSSPTTTDAVIDLQTTAAALSMGRRSDEQIKTAMLDAAEMIRVLEITLDAKNEVLKG